MAKINQDLLDAIVKKAKISKVTVYARIKQVAGAELLPRHLAAIRVGADVGLAINKFATTEELAELRRAGTPVAPPPPAPQVGVAKTTKAKGGKVSPRRGPAKPPNQVFVVHGRDGIAKAALFAFLRAIDVKPIEWNAAIKATGKAAPYIGEILDSAFNQARAVVVLLTPDDLAQMRSELLLKSDPSFEKRLMGQARPNVLFEAGMAFSSHPDRTVLVQLGNLRPFSDVAGRHVVRMSDDFASRQELATKLANAGCDTDTGGTDWVTAGDFTDPETRAQGEKVARKRVAKRVKRKKP